MPDYRPGKKRYYRVSEIDPTDWNSLPIILYKYSGLHIGTISTGGKAYRKYLVYITPEDLVALKLSVTSAMKTEELDFNEIEYYRKQGFVAD